MTGTRVDTAPGATAGDGGRRSRRIAVVPAYNEEPTVVSVLDELYRHVDELVVVDDGSTDGTRREIERWLPGHDRAQLLVHEVNQGMSEAYFLALTSLRERFHRGRTLRRRRDRQHFLPPVRVRPQAVLGRRELQQGGQPAAREMANAARQDRGGEQNRLRDV